MPASETRAGFRDAFERWGLPEAIRVDNGWPWGSAGDLPTDLALWTLGLGVKVIWNPPRQPQKNGVVERSQGTGKRWADPKTCKDIDALRLRLAEQDAIQREDYPSIRGLSRMAAFPGLVHSGRRYGRESEAQQWDVQHAWDHVAEYVLSRRVDCGGTISLYNRSHHIGKTLRGRDVYVSLDPLAVEWRFCDHAGVCQHHRKAEELSAERILALNVSRHRDRPDRRRQKPPPPLPAQPGGA